MYKKKNKSNGINITCADKKGNRIFFRDLKKKIFSLYFS